MTPMDSARLACAATPACMRGDLAVSKAYDHGFRFAVQGLTRDYNFYASDGVERPLHRAWDEGWASGRDAYVQADSDEERAAIASMLGIE